ncbi:MAG: single-stranded-DNA-specific exonuclease RecJ [Smithella sp.]|nr:single-stranded-DNA-specific exonuclease RecJ [Smithella sp.]MDM7987720.1 single-stranded-DNA-specific exonuclease RecJ [Smithella sp.]HOU50467.1 single-stranded-DNA-specific exonuclease RecJ [Smithella sp.]HQG65091.1 single-stranded-DNA-specific exonuclease RecJ [Smithella sp.]HQH15921.1 single-stranded-DNA-specific exonuclease RecJ [Smithella sp.]
MTINNQLPLTKWNLNDSGNKNTEELFSREFGIHPIIAQILINRGFRDIESARRYLYPSLNDLHSPFLMKDIKKGVARLTKAIHNKEKIVIYGDYDADGITSVVILLKFIRQVTPFIDYYIPDRIQEGYGLSIAAIDKFKQDKVGLIITVDCGISDVEQIAYAQSIGIDTIILDHHEISGDLPPAVAAINPNREDCAFPFKGLAGVGIAYNFLIALRGTLNKEGFWKNKNYPNLKEYLDIVSLGTIGDIAPLIDENRIFTKIGLELITEGRRPGIKALKEVSGVDNQVIDSFKASFSLIPRINAAGRIASPSDAVKLLMTDDISEARVLAEKLDSYNRHRQLMEKKILNDILDIISRNESIEKTNSLVFASDQWHPGIIGIVASRLVELYNRPAFVISLQDGLGKGSGRSVSGFNIYKGIQQCAHLLVSYGGHYHAAGISIKKENIDEFKDLLDQIAMSNAEMSDMTYQINIDAECPIESTRADWITQFELLAPFGSKNPEPLLYARNVKASAPIVVGNNHLKMWVNSNNASRDSIWFNMGKYINALNGATFDIVFTPQINNWNGSQDIQLKIKDINIVS